MTRNTTGTSHLPDRSTGSMIFLCDPSQEAATDQTATSSANTTTATTLDSGPIARNSGVWTEMLPAPFPQIGRRSWPAASYGHYDHVHPLLSALRRPHVGYPPQYGQPPQGETGRGLAVIVVLALGVAIGAVITVFMVLNPPSSPPGAAPTRDTEHSEASVRQAAQPALDAYSSGSYGDFWDLWTTGAQGLITREEYVRLFDLCPPLVANSPLTIAAVTITGDSATVQAERLGDTTEFGFVFESDSWRYEPPPQERSEYQKPVDQIAEQRRAAGFCGTVIPAPGTSDSAPGSSDPGTAPGPGPGTGSSPSTQPSGFLARAADIKVM